MIKDGIIINKKSPNGYDSFYRKVNTNNDNINPGQQPSATNTQSRFLSDTFTLPQDNIKTPVVDKILEFKKRKILIESFVYSNFNYCPLVLHFCNQKSSQKVENLKKKSPPVPSE